MAALKWGICGAGMISSDFCHAVKTLSAERHELHAVGARSLNSAKEFAEKLNIPKAYGSYEEVANDPEVEIVYIGVIHTHHVRLSMMMLEAGKHVMCEKPLTYSWEECKKVLDFAKQKNLLFIEACWSRFFPCYKALKEEITSGKLGEVSMVTAQFAIPLMDIERICKKELMGGVLLDIGFYCVQFACHIYGEMPEKIIATGSLTEEGIDEDGCVTLLYSRNRKASLVYSGKTVGQYNCATVMGSQAKIFIDESFWCPKEIKLTDRTVSNELPDGPYNFINSGGLRYEADEAYTLIRNGIMESDIYGYKEVEMVHKVIDEIRKQIGLQY